MASYSVAASEVGVRSKTLTAATVDTVTFSSDFDKVEVVNVDGAAAIYFTVDRNAPTVAGNNTYELPATMAAYVASVPTSGNVVVKLISSGTPKYSVTEVFA